MECACIGNEYEGEGWDFEPTESYPVAKKNWRCGECGRVIPVGEKYYCHTGKWNGKFGVDRTCLDCSSVIEHLFCGHAFGQAWEQLQDHLHDHGVDGLSWSRIAKLTPAAREKVCDVIEDVWRREEE